MTTNQGFIEKNLKGGQKQSSYFLEGGDYKAKQITLSLQDMSLISFKCTCTLCVLHLP